MLKGLQAGDIVATSANFLIDSESQLQAAAGSYTPPPPGAGTELSISSQQVSAEFATNPSPPHKGKNEIQVKVLSPDGKPLSGGKVVVRFFMAAMPQMGMGEMSTTVQLTERGLGNYAGQLELGSGGTWHVTISVEQGGKLLLTKQLSVGATGGM